MQGVRNDNQNIPNNDFDVLLEPYLKTDEIKGKIINGQYELAFELQGNLIDEIGHKIESQNFRNVRELYNLRVEYPILGDPIALLMPFSRFNFEKLSEKESACLAYM